MRHSILSLTMRLIGLASYSRTVPLLNNRKVPLKFSSGYLRSTEATLRSSATFSTLHMLLVRARQEISADTNQGPRLAIPLARGAWRGAFSRWAVMKALSLLSCLHRVTSGV